MLRPLSAPTTQGAVGAVGSEEVGAEEVGNMKGAAGRKGNGEVM